MTILSGRRRTRASLRERSAGDGKGLARPALGDDAGYTLIEMLVVLALTAIITGLMATSLGNLRKIRALDDQLQQQAQLDAVAALIASDLRAALDVPLLSAEPGRQMHFEGSAHEMTFVALVRTGFQSRSLRQVHYRVHDVQGRRKLVRETVPYRFADTKYEDEELVELLLPDIGDFTLLWRGQDEQSWRQSWKAERQFPIAFYVSLKFLSAGTAHTVMGLEPH